MLTLVPVWNSVQPFQNDMISGKFLWILFFFLFQKTLLMELPRIALMIPRWTVTYHAISLLVTVLHTCVEISKILYMKNILYDGKS